jgi:hypothetical protein
MHVFENRVLRGISGPKRDDVPGGGKDYITEIFIIYTLHHIIGMIISMEMGRACSAHRGNERCDTELSLERLKNKR